MTITRDDAHIARQVAQHAYLKVWKQPLDVSTSTDRLKALRTRVSGKSAEVLETTIRVWEQLDQITGESGHAIPEIGYYEEIDPDWDTLRFEWRLVDNATRSVLAHGDYGEWPELGPEKESG